MRLAVSCLKDRVRLTRRLPYQAAYFCHILTQQIGSILEGLESPRHPLIWEEFPY